MIDRSRRLLSAALVMVAVMAGLASVSQARIIGTNPQPATVNDLWCNGGRVRAGTPIAYTEICQDWLGNLVPTSTLGNQTIGTSTLPWQAIYSSTNVNTGNQTSGAAGSANTTNVGGVAATQDIVVGLSVYAKVALTGVVSSTCVPVNASYETIMSTSNGAVSILSLPSISTATVPGGATELPSGTYLVLSSTGASGATFFDEGTLTGSRLQLGAASRAVTQFDVLTLIYDATDHFWREVSYTNN